MDNIRVCPICNSAINETDAVIVCEKCGASHHKDCWELNDGCGNPKCGITQSVAQPAVNVQNNNLSDNSQSAYNAPVQTGMPSNQNNVSANAPQRYYTANPAPQPYTPQSQNTYNTYMPQPSPYNYDDNSPGYPQYNQPQRKRMSGGKKAAIISSIMAAFTVIIIAVVFIVTGAIGSTQKADYYKIGNNSIPSVKHVVGERKITGVSTSSNENVTQLAYTYSGMSADDIEKYVSYLKINNHFFPAFKADDNIDFSNNSGMVLLKANAAEAGKVILFSVQWTENKCWISITLSK